MIGLKALFITMMIVIFTVAGAWLLMQAILTWPWLLPTVFIGGVVYTLYLGVYYHLKNKAERHRW